MTGYAWLENKRGNVTSTELRDFIKPKDVKVENLQSELAQIKQALQD